MSWNLAWAPVSSLACDVLWQLSGHGGAVHSSKLYKASWGARPSISGGLASGWHLQRRSKVARGRPQEAAPKQPATNRAEHRPGARTPIQRSSHEDEPMGGESSQVGQISSFGLKWIAVSTQKTKYARSTKPGEQRGSIPVTPCSLGKRQPESMGNQSGSTRPRLPFRCFMSRVPSRGPAGTPVVSWRRVEGADAECYVAAHE